MKTQRELHALLQKAFWVIMFYTDKNHTGDCVFTDKADEGCYLCNEAEQKAWPEIAEITKNIKAALNEN